MWRFRTIIVLGALAGMVIFGATIAHGAWWWNSHLNVEGQSLRTAWTVEDDPDGVDDYWGTIKLTLPPGTDATVLEVAPNEELDVVYSNSVSCQPDGIEARVAYTIKPLTGVDGSQVYVNVNVNGILVGEKYGKVRRTLGIDILIPAANPSCYSPAEETSSSTSGDASQPKGKGFGKGGKK